MKVVQMFDLENQNGAVFDLENQSGAVFDLENQSGAVVLTTILCYLWATIDGVVWFILITCVSVSVRVFGTMRNFLENR